MWVSRHCRQAGSCSIPAQSKSGLSYWRTSIKAYGHDCGSIYSKMRQQEVFSGFITCNYVAVGPKASG